jgi:hypothetical protein
VSQFETWLTEEDTQRLWNVCHGLLPETAATPDEIIEFERVVTHAAMLKMGGTGYDSAPLH